MGTSPSKPASAPAQHQHYSDEKRVAIVTESLAALDVQPAAKVDKPLSSDGTIKAGNLEQWEKEIAQDPRIDVSRATLNHTDFKRALLSRKKTIADVHVYNTHLSLDPNKKVTNQKSSGRCWLFATTNIIRYNVANALGLENFELSQSYLSFYDKLNKANYYLELSIENIDLPIDDRLVVHLASDPVGDGGQWDMALNLVQNYGVVPQSIFPESWTSSNTSRVNTIITSKLREHALLLWASAASLKASLIHLPQEQRDKEVIASLRKQKEAYIGEIYKILTIAQGEPPKPSEKFTWEYYNAKHEYKKWTGTPIEFYQAFGNKQYPLLEAFSLINDPRNEYGKLYTVEKLGNVWNGTPIRYVNTTSENLKAAAVKCIKAGQPVFFGCDMGKSSENSTGIMDTGLYEFETAFNVKFGLSKADRLRTGETQMTHAMVITAVHVDDKGKPVRFRVENSWAETVGKEGYFMMTDSWFDEYVFQVVVPRQLAPSSLVKVLDTEPIVLKPWDPLGALA